MAILNSPRDLTLAREQHWYRIPVTSVEKFLKKRWPPNCLAFYLPKVFGEDAYSIRHYARVLSISLVDRRTLFPDETPNAKSQTQYYKLDLAPLQQLPYPILSRRRRRIAFIPTTFKKLIQAVEINDLSDESPLEDRLWAEFKRLNIDAERQELVRVGRKNYFLDFAIYCQAGSLNIETDGDTWHSNKERSPLDNLRDNDLKTSGWHTLRFNTRQVQEEMQDYCVPTIAKAINNLGGLGPERRLILELPDPISESGAQQLNLFQDL